LVIRIKCRIAADADRRGEATRLFHLNVLFPAVGAFISRCAQSIDRAHSRKAAAMLRFPKLERCCESLGRDTHLDHSRPRFSPRGEVGSPSFEVGDRVLFHKLRRASSIAARPRSSEAVAMLRRCGCGSLMRGAPLDSFETPLAPLLFLSI
jgi:hypothetical protein